MYKYEYFEMNNMQTIFLSVANLKCALSDRKIHPNGYMHPRFWTLGWILGVRLRLGFKAGVTKLFETQSCFLVQIHAKGYQFDTDFWNKNLHILSSYDVIINNKN